MPVASFSFQRKMLLVFAVSVLISTVLATQVLYWDHRRGILEETIGRQELFATSLAQISQWEIQNAVTDLELLAKNPTFAELNRNWVERAHNGVPPGREARKRRLLDGFQANYPLFSVLFLLLPNGDHYISHPYAVQRNLRKYNLANRPYFREVQRTRRPVVSDGFLGADGELAVVIDVPILAESGAIQAHLGGVFHLDDLSSLVSPARIGEAGAGFIVDAHGALIAHTEANLVHSALREQFASHPLLRNHFSANRPVTTLVYTDPLDGREYVGTVVSMENGWCFALSRLTAEMEGLAFSHALRMAGGLALLLLLISGIALFVAQHLVKRGDQAELALRRAKDDMERLVHERGADLIATNKRLEREIAERSRAEQALQTHRDSLEELVATRTRELMETNTRLENEIGERRRSEAALQERETHLRSVVGNAPIILFAIDMEGKVTLSEGRGLIKRGRKPGQVVGLSIFEMYLDRPDIVANIRRALAGEQVTARIALAELTYETAYVPFRDDSGRIVGMIGVANDITDRVRAEEALRKGEMSLARAQQIAHLGNWDWNLTTNEMIWSDETFRILGLSKHAGTPSYEAYLAAIHPDDREQVKSRIGALIDGHEPLVMEHRIVRPDGDERVVDLRAEVIYDGQERAVGMIGTVHDITDRKGVELELKAFAGKLERSNRDLQEFAYMVSHDLQEPLNTIHSLGERVWLRLDDLLADEDRRDFAQILGSASRMKLLIQKVLALSRVTTHAQPFVPVDLNGVAQAVLSDLRVRLEDVQGRVELGELPTIEGDPVQLRQLLQNLIANGLKFHRPRHPPLVKVSGHLFTDPVSEEEGGQAAVAGYCELTVEDNGIGFDEVDAERIFTPFQRLQEGRRFKGTGVGLATCRRIVERHGGTVRAIGSPGKGAKFVVTLPMKRPEPLSIA